MESASGNPASNVLGPGADDRLVAEAVSASGYPLQLVVSGLLRETFALQEEWAYPDRETGTTRTIDIVASRMLWAWSEPQPRIRPQLDLVIECRQSELPYVFFLGDGHPRLPHFPMIAGLSRSEVTLVTDDDPSTWTFPVLDALGLGAHPFMRATAPWCAVFSKCVRQGSKLVLSGSDPYQSLVFPVINAVHHFCEVCRPPSTALYYDCHLAIGLAVLDAPMVGVRVTDQGCRMALLPWVRIARHEPCEGEHPFLRTHTFGIDVVHRDYLKTYLDDQVTPFADEFAARALRHAQVLADSRGFAAGMSADGMQGIESRLRPASFVTARKHGKAILRHLAALLFGRRHRH